MADRIDRAAEAAAQIKSWDRSGVSSGIVEARMISSAILALAEQQRLANLIAIMTHAARMVADGTGSSEDYLSVYSKVDPLIREGLGL